MAKPFILKPFIRKWEGGYCNNPNDKGGETKWGVTHTTYNSIYKGSVKNMTEEQWDFIFTTLYWDKCNADSIDNQNVANIIVDWCWHSGVAKVKKKIQRLFGLVDDGVFGDKTLKVLNTNTKSVFNTIWNARAKFFCDIVANNPSQKVFYNGWMNRLNALKYNEQYCNTK